MARLFENGAFEKDIVRIGAEQERHLINRRYGSAPVASEILRLLQDP